jgi:hypothetical protein
MGFFMLTTVYLRAKRAEHIFIRDIFCCNEALETWTGITGLEGAQQKQETISYIEVYCSWRRKLI